MNFSSRSAIACAAFLIFWIAFDLFSELNHFQERNLLVSDIAELYVVKIPDFLVLILPVALLLALLYTLTNHARHHELTAIDMLLPRASGCGASVFLISRWGCC